MIKVTVFVVIPRCEHPRPDRQRAEWLTLNGEWDFEIDNALVGVERKFYERESLSSKITVPFCPESRLSGVGHTDFMSAVWYRRNIDIPTEWGTKRVLLHIDACDYDTTVYVNGKRVGSHVGGYTPFAFDITDALKDDGNYVTVYARDDTRSDWQVSGKQSTKLNSYGCFYTRTTGIWQSPKLERHTAFPDGVNVEFVQVLGNNALRMRVWERGSGVTMACGTGACASVMAAISKNYCCYDAPVAVHLDGGTLVIRIASDNTVTMTGPAEIVYEGETKLC